MHNLTKGKSSAFGNKVQAVNTKVQKIITASGGAHTFSEEEKISFVDFINSSLASDPLMKDKLPINPDNNDIFGACKDGLLLW